MCESTFAILIATISFVVNYIIIVYERKEKNMNYKLQFRIQN